MPIQEKPEECLPAFKNPPRMPSTMAIAFTANELNGKQAGHEKDRVRKTAEQEITLPTGGPAPKTP